MTQSRAADDFATIRTRMEELRRARSDARHGRRDSVGPTDALCSQRILVAARDQRRARTGPPIRPYARLEAVST